jgi:hypothetical protein
LSLDLSGSANEATSDPPVRSRTKYEIVQKVGNIAFALRFLIEWALRGIAHDQDRWCARKNASSVASLVGRGAGHNICFVVSRGDNQNTERHGANNEADLLRALKLVVAPHSQNP